jgi:RNA polymerase sigma-70 factor (ECF subfamily)
VEDTLGAERPTSDGAALDGETLYRSYVRPIYGFIYSKVGNRETAEDLTSDVFLRALTHVDGEREEHSVVAWLYRVARNLVNDFWRQGQAAQVIALDEMRHPRSSASPPDLARQDRTAQRAMDVLSRLPENYRLVLQYRLLDGLSVAETAEQMATSRANVKVLQHRALKRAAELRGDDE